MSSVPDGAIAPGTNSTVPKAAPSGDTRGQPDDESGKLPLLEDLMQLSRLGDIGPVKQLFDAKKFGADFKDAEGITPLHWAAINNHYAMCKFLIEAGADVNAKGGEAVATPAMWAAQRCNYYVVNLLLEHGADPLLTDAQGYNILHLATFDGNVFLLILLLHQNIPIDTPDLQGHTSLMWAAYKGYPACVDLFLRWGANVSATDDNGFTALHWALVKGSAGCIQKLIEYGSDRFAETSDGKTPGTVAVEMKSLRIWTNALNECGFDENGQVKKLPLPLGSSLLSNRSLSRFYFLYPFAILPLLISILSAFSALVAIPVALASGYAMHLVALKLLAYAPIDMRQLHKTPYLSGVFAATGFWVGVRWLFRILPYTWRSHFIANVVFGSLYGLCGYFYIMSMTEDPGHVPKAGSRAQQKATVTELLGLWKFDDQNFCVQCMIRTPLRSKHCRRCKRCVAKHDHHCPWIHNCVGANNLRHFVLYVATMEIGVIVLIHLVLAYLEALPAESKAECSILAETICRVVMVDAFTVLLTFWTTLQLTWVTMLLFVQCVQIARAITTYESMRGLPDHSSRTTEALTAAITAGAMSMDGAQLRAGQDETSYPSGGRRQGCFNHLKKLLGLDTFMATAQSEMDRGSFRRRRNPYSRGILTNCRDFWCDPAPVFGKRETGASMLDGETINYTRVYELPLTMKNLRGRVDDSRGRDDGNAV